MSSSISSITLKLAPGGPKGTPPESMFHPELKFLKEVITRSVFVPFSVFYLKEPLKQDYLWAGLCLVGAVYFMFRSKGA